MGDNDEDLREPSNWYSDVINTGVEYVMGLGDSGFTTQRRGEQGDGDATGAAEGDNSFYRDNADWMPGWGNTFGLDFLDPNNHPSGATAQDRATNHVGHNDPTGIWGDVRTNLVENESAAIDSARERGDTNISFGDVYDSHVHAYDDAQQAARERDPSSEAANPFIDPASFGLAMYAAPMLEHVGIDAGPITGASIDLFNDPTNSVGEGWARRMALGAGEMGVGTALSMINPMLGAPLQRLGGETISHNTGTAIDHGMGVEEAAGGIGELGSDLADAGLDVAGDAARLLIPGASLFL